MPTELTRICFYQIVQFLNLEVTHSQWILMRPGLLSSCALLWGMKYANCLCEVFCLMCSASAEYTISDVFIFNLSLTDTHSNRRDMTMIC